MSKDPSLVVYDDFGGGRVRLSDLSKGAKPLAPLPNRLRLMRIDAALVD